MATVLIPEVIEPGVLYAPDANNFFSINSAALPNGDNELACDGASGNFRAFQPAIAGVHYPADPNDPFTVAFVLNLGTPEGLGSASRLLSNREVIMGVWGPTASASNQNDSTSTDQFAWAITHQESGTSRYNNLVYHRAVGASSRAYVGMQFGSSGRRLVVVRDPGGGVAPTMHFDGLSTGGTTSGGGTVGTPGTLTDPCFCIGPYPLTTGWRSSTDGNLALSKVALFNRLLTDQEVLDLYDSLINGPPSP